MLAEKLGFYSLCLTLFLFGFPGNWVFYGLGAFLFFSLVAWILEPRGTVNILISKWYLIVPFLSYFLLYFAFAVKEGFEWRYLENRLTFLLLPLLGISLFRTHEFRKRRHQIIKVFIFGLLVICTFLLIRALLIKMGIIPDQSIPENSIETVYAKFISRYLSFFQHPAYFSMEINLAVILLIIYRKDLNIPFSLLLAFVVFFVCFIFLLSSRAGILASILSFLFLAFREINQLKFKKLYSYGLLAVFGFTLILFILLNPRIAGKIHELSDKFKGNIPLSAKDLEPRTRVWYSSLILIKDNPILGIGLKNFDQKLNEEYRLNGFYSEAFFTLNSHNQFLESQLAFGIPGTIILLWMILVPFLSRRKKILQPFQVSFLLIIFTHFMFESMLVRQWGILFFVMFSLFYLPLDTENESLKK